MANDGDDDPVWGTNVKEIAAWRRSRNTSGSTERADASAAGPAIERHRGEVWVEAELPIRPWIVPGFLMRQTVTAMAGAGGAGKSLLALGIGVAAALGMPYGRFLPQARLRVQMYSVEDNYVEQKKRISATLRQFGKTPADIADWMEFDEPTEDPELLRWGIGEDGLFELRTTRAWEAIEDAINDFKPDVYMFDPLGELSSAPENDNAAQRRVFGHYRRLAIRHNMAVLLVDHSRKGSQQDAGNADIQRGAGSKVQSSRLALTCTVMTKPEAEQHGIDTNPEIMAGFLRLTGAKANYVRAGATEWYEKTEYELDNGEMTPAAVPWKPAPTKTLDEAQVARLVTQIGMGIEGEPYLVHAARSARTSITHLLDSVGIATKGATWKLHRRLGDLGVVKQKFRNADSKERWGFRTKEGLPPAHWVTEAGELEDRQIEDEVPPVNDDLPPVEGNDPPVIGSPIPW